jgi:hypothetical protein
MFEENRTTMEKGRNIQESGGLGAKAAGEKKENASTY